MDNTTKVPGEMDVTLQGIKYLQSPRQVVKGILLSARKGSAHTI